MSQQTTLRQYHSTRLVSGLRRQLWDGDYDAAAKTCVVLEQHGITSPLLYKVMLEVIRRDDDSQAKCTRLFRTLLGKSVLPSQAVLLEFVCYLIDGGLLQEAFDNLEGYVSRPPFKYNAVIHGYYGMLAVALWREAEKKRDAQATTATKSHQLLKTAERHLERARELDPTCEMYHRSLVEVLEAKDLDPAAVRGVVETWCHEDGSHPGGHLMLARHLAAHPDPVAPTHPQDTCRCPCRPLRHMRRCCRSLVRLPKASRVPQVSIRPLWSRSKRWWSGTKRATWARRLCWKHARATWRLLRAFQATTARGCPPWCGRGSITVWRATRVP